jgi:hypothetical protein
VNILAKLIKYCRKFKCASAGNVYKKKVSHKILCYIQKSIILFYAKNSKFYAQSYQIIVARKRATFLRSFLINIYLSNMFRFWGKKSDYFKNAILDALSQVKIRGEIIEIFFFANIL